MELDEFKKKEKEAKANKETMINRGKHILFLVVSIVLCIVMGYGTYNDSPWAKVISGVGLAIDLLCIFHTQIQKKKIVNEKEKKDAA